MYGTIFTPSILSTFIWFLSSFSLILSYCFGPGAHIIWYFSSGLRSIVCIVFSFVIEIFLLFFALFSTISSKAEFIDAAPWLPPNTNTNGILLSNPISFFFLSFSSLLRFKFLIFVGVPVTITFAPFGKRSFASSNPTKILLAFLANNFVATPGKTLLSCIT